jgi:hypothetical protein
MMDAQRDYWTCFFRMPWKPKDLERLGGEIEEIFTQCWTKEAFSTPDVAGGGGRTSSSPATVSRPTTPYL